MSTILPPVELKPRRPRNYYVDIYPLRHTLRYAIKGFFVAVILLCLFSLCLAIESGINSSIAATNEKAEAFNALPLEDRLMIAEFSDLDVDPETATLSVHETSTPVEQFVKDGGLVIPVVVACAIVSWLAFAGYVKSRKEIFGGNFYLWDLPLCTIYGWVMLISIIAAWPVLFISWLIALVQHARATMAERLEVKRLARTETFKNEANKILAPANTCYSPKARESYLKRRVEWRSGEQARYMWLESEVVPEFQAICALPFVASISAPDPRNKTELPRITIKPRITKNGETYDLGDYDVYLDTYGSFRCVCIRSGIKLNRVHPVRNYFMLYEVIASTHNHTDALCRYSSQHIADLFKKGFIEFGLIDLAMNYVTYFNEAREKELDYFFRKVSTVRKAEQRLRRTSKRP